MLRQAKLAVLDAARRSGLASRIAASEWRRRRLLILCYHGVSLDDEHLWSDLYVDSDHLRQRFTYLKDNGYHVIPLGTALQSLAAGTLPERAVSLTFDDGTYDFIAQAYPLLQEFGYHATLYLTTYYCADQRPVFDTVLSYLLWKGKGRRVSLGGDLGGEHGIPLDDGARVKLHGQLRERANLSKLSAQSKDEVARNLARQVDVDYQGLRRRRLFHQMNPQEVASLDAAYVSVQLHTHRHRTPRDEGLFIRELADNRDAIVAMRPSQEAPRHFCYPSGDFDPIFFPWLASAGVVSATTCQAGLATSSSAPFLLPRFLDSMGIPLPVFESWVAGHGSWLPSARR